MQTVGVDALDGTHAKLRGPRPSSTASSSSSTSHAPRPRRVRPPPQATPLVDSVPFTRFVPPFSSAPRSLADGSPFFFRQHHNVPSLFPSFLSLPPASTALVCGQAGRVDCRRGRARWDACEAPRTTSLVDGESPSTGHVPRQWRPFHGVCPSCSP